MDVNEIGTVVIQCAIEVHKELGPGLLESVYEIALSYLLNKKGLENQRQVRIPIRFQEIEFEEGFRADIVVRNQVIVELKSKSSISLADRKQLQTQLNLSGHKLGYLLNFGEAYMKDGIVRAVNGLK